MGYSEPAMLSTILAYLRYLRYLFVFGILSPPCSPRGLATLRVSTPSQRAGKPTHEKALSLV